MRAKQVHWGLCVMAKGASLGQGLASCALCLLLHMQHQACAVQTSCSLPCPLQMFGQLQRGLSVTTPEGQVIEPSMVSVVQPNVGVGQVRPYSCFVFLCMPCPHAPEHTALPHNFLLLPTPHPGHGQPQPGGTTGGGGGPAQHAAPGGCQAGGSTGQVACGGWPRAMSRFELRI